MRECKQTKVNYKRKSKSRT